MACRANTLRGRSIILGTTFVHPVFFFLRPDALQKSVLRLDEDLRDALPRTPPLVRLRLFDYEGGCIDVLLDNQNDALRGKDLGAFFSRYIEAGLDPEEGAAPLYIARLIGERNAHLLLTPDERHWCQLVQPHPSVSLARRETAAAVAPAPSLRQQARPIVIKDRDARESARAPGGATGKRARKDKNAAVSEAGAEYARLAQEAVRIGLLCFPPAFAVPVDDGSCDSCLALLDKGEFAPPAAFAAHEQALALSASPGFDRLLSLDLANVKPFPYQIGAVREVLQRMRGRAILADEVGLGKTIEAGLVAMEYILRGLVRRILVLCPPSLIEQWREELKTKFGLETVAADDPALAAAGNPWREADRIVASLDTAKREPHVGLLADTPFDLVVVDEAHRCHNRKTQAWRLVDRLQKKYILLLTATPVQNDLQELFNLITLLRPGQLETAADFTRKYVTRGDRLKPRNSPELRALTREVMVRNRRETCGLVLPRRRAETVRIELAPDEAELYEEVSGWIRTAVREGRATGAARLALKTVQKEAGSSPAAVLPTLAKLRRSSLFTSIPPACEKLLARRPSGFASAKATALLNLIGATSGEKVLVFTGFTATLHYLAEALRAAGVRYAVFSGELTRRQKDQSVQSFRDEVQVLLSTESGGEGRNLQFCRVMVNYDLPWNPMRIEQRIGRLHRIGQEREVRIFNFSAARTLESQLLEILDAKINLFELVVGELDMILGAIEDERDFEDTLLDLWAGADEEARRDGFRAFGERLQVAKSRYDRTKQYEDELFGTDLATVEGEAGK